MMERWVDGGLVGWMEALTIFPFLFKKSVGIKKLLLLF